MPRETKLFCRTFKDNQALQLFALAYNLASFPRRLALPKGIQPWSLTTVREELVIQSGPWQERRGMHGRRAEDHAKTTFTEGVSSVRIARGAPAWTRNRRADWKTKRRIVNVVRLLPFGAYPSGAYMENPGRKRKTGEAERAQPAHGDSLEEANMTRRLAVACGSFLSLLVLASAGEAAATGTAAQVSRSEVEAWFRWAAPLPKRISIPAKVVAPAEAVRVVVRGPADDVLQCAVDALRRGLGQKSGETAPGQGAGLEIVVGICDQRGRLGDLAVPGAEELAGLPNREQAYRIAPAGEGRLALVGLSARGASYAAATLRQLVAAKAAGGRVEVPLTQVTDWPDLAERGIWSFGANYDERELDWFASQKFNHLEKTAELLLQKGKPVATLDPKALERCRLHGIDMMPVVIHLEQLAGRGIFETYPEIRGKGKFPDWAYVICFSQPNAQRLLDDWLTLLARNVASDDVMVWLSENNVHCQCEKCKAIEQFEQEIQVVIHAWRAAQKVRPTLRLRLLLTQATYPQNVKILRSTSRDVRITYYDGTRTYTLARQPMIYPELRAAAAGRWLGCYPTLCGTWYTASPLAGAAYMKERMGELAEVGATSMAGYVTESLRVNEFSLSAAAEFAWNAKGRTPREFVLAWATRRRFSDPEKVARWWKQLEEPQRDLYLSNLTADGFGRQVARLADMRAPAKPGSWILTGFPQQGSLAADIESARRAAEIGATLREPRFVQEARYTLAVLEAARACRDLTLRIAGRKKLSEADKHDAAALAERACAEFARASEAIAAWDQAAELFPGQKHATEVKSVVKNFETIRTDLVECACKLGISAEFMEYVRQRVDSWETGTFPASGARVERVTDVSRHVRRPGAYDVVFQYKRGLEMLHVDRLALVARRADGSRQEVAVDAHSGYTGAWNSRNVYRLELKEFDAQARYEVVARAGTGTRANGTWQSGPARATCSGCEHARRDFRYERTLVGAWPSMSFGRGQFARRNPR